MVAKNFALAFGIAVVFPMLVHYGVSTFSPKPKWENYAAQGGFDYATASRQERLDHQAEQMRLNEDRKAAEKRFELRLFAVAAPLGVVAILCGALLQAQSIGAGLIFGGIFSVCDGYFNYWGELADVLKFASLLVTFIVLIVVGYKKLEKKQA
jgi:hypothetical protein